MRNQSKRALIVASLAFFAVACDCDSVTAPTSATVTPSGGSNSTISAQIATGGVHACSLTTAGVAKCWGFGGAGQLGSGTAASSLSPVAVAGGHVFSMMDTGDDDDDGSTCGLTTSGQAWCWGINAEGQLGDGLSHSTVFSVDYSATPVLVAGNHTFTQLNTGDATACAVTAAGEAWCWGHNYAGNLGDGTQTNRSTPVKVLTTVSFVQVDVSDGTTCGRTAAGDVWCWGQISATAGCANISSDCTKTPEKVAGLPALAQITVGNGFGCGVTAAGDPWCWGNNTTGALGGGGVATDRISGSVIPNPAFATVAAPAVVHVAGGHAFAEIRAGHWHACGRKTNGEMWCWGDNSIGQLGDGSTTTRTSPVKVTGGLSFAAIAAGASTSCGVATNGDMYCWGENTAGQAGDRTTTDRSSPVKVIQ